MKKIIVICVQLFVCSLALAQTPSSDKCVKSDIEKLRFEVELNKARYLSFEPLVVKFKISNRSTVAISTESPQFLLHSSVKVVKANGETVDLRSLSLDTGGGVHLPGPQQSLGPFQSYEDECIPAMDPEIFAESGRYRLQFFLNGLESNIVDMEVMNPEGIDQDAFEFLKEHGRDIWFGRILQEKNGSELLETFVEKYSGSGYGDYAIASLGKYYLFFEKELGKAEAQLKKTRSSENGVIARDSNKSLADIAKRKAELRKPETGTRSHPQ